MDELDLLLEELALEPAGSGNDGNRSSDPASEEGAGTVCSGLTKRGSDNDKSHVHRDLPGPATASLTTDSPTKELDSILQDLMGLGSGDPASSNPPLLTQNQPDKNKTEGGYQDPKVSAQSTKTDSIDDLLGGLNSDLQSIGVHTISKGRCAACNKSIVGKMITAMGEVWHLEHFVCAVCKIELSAIGFFEKEGRPYCDKDYHQLFSPRCAYCKGPILKNILTALDQTWHPEHFFCTHCGGLFGEEGFQEKDGRPYCCRDFYQLFAPKCSGCGEPVRENYLTAANGTWHPACFVCADCLRPFSGSSFMELDGRPLCSLHFHSRQGTLCGRCNEPITGRCISALDRKFHPEHFVCAFCRRQLRHGVFKEYAGKPYCSLCFDKLFV